MRVSRLLQSEFYSSLISLELPPPPDPVNISGEKIEAVPNLQLKLELSDDLVNLVIIGFRLEYK